MKSLSEWYANKPELGFPDPGSDDRIRRSIEMILSEKPRTVLDIGCGNGSTSMRIAERSKARVEAVDISEVSVAAAISLGITATVCQIGLEQLPYNDGVFDVVYMGEVIEHLLFPDAALVEIKRVLKLDGVLIMSTPNLACLLNRTLLLFGIQPFFTEVSTKEILGRKFKLFGEHGAPVGHLRVMTFSGLRELLTTNGFEIVEATGATFLKSRLFRNIERLFVKLPSIASLIVVKTKPTS
jgi:ubiquinone/menaquinone biosynthesis C-methylase UbiE